MSGIFLDAALLDGLVEKARTAPRRRSHHNLHTDLNAPAQRLLVAMEPDSYVCPHCHRDATKAETLFVLRGCLGALIFDASGRVLEARVLTAGGANVGYDVPPGVLHAIVALESGTVFLEAKAGPYVPLDNSEWGDWAPLEGSPGVPAYLAAMKAAFSPE